MNNDELEFFDGDQTMAEWLRRRSIYFHEKFNPQFGSSYDTTSGVEIRVRDVIAYGTVQRAKLAPIVIGGTALMDPTVTTEVTNVGGAQTYHATPGAGGGILGFLGTVFGWDE